MGLLRPSLERMKLDKRMQDINLKNRTLKKTEIDSHLKSLPDLSDQAQPLGFNHDLGKSRLN
jgi:hypothetical protein